MVNRPKTLITARVFEEDKSYLLSRPDLDMSNVLRTLLADWVRKERKRGN